MYDVSGMPLSFECVLRHETLLALYAAHRDCTFPIVRVLQRSQTFLEGGGDKAPCRRMQMGNRYVWTWTGVEDLETRAVLKTSTTPPELGGGAFSYLPYPEG